MSRRDILVIEDDDSIRQVLKVSLELEGYRVFEGGDGQQGLKTLLEMPSKPGLILLDLMMPVMDGWEFCDALKREKQFTDIPIVVVTAFPERANTLREATEVLTKPISLDRLLQVANKYCNGGDINVNSPSAKTQNIQWQY